MNIERLPRTKKRRGSKRMAGELRMNTSGVRKRNPNCLGEKSAIEKLQDKPDKKNQPNGENNQGIDRGKELNFLRRLQNDATSNGKGFHFGPKFDGSTKMIIFYEFPLGFPNQVSTKCLFSFEGDLSEKINKYIGPAFGRKILQYLQDGYSYSPTSFMEVCVNPGFDARNVIAELGYNEDSVRGFSLKALLKSRSRFSSIDRAGLIEFIENKYRQRHEEKVQNDEHKDHSYRGATKNDVKGWISQFRSENGFGHGSRSLYNRMIKRLTREGVVVISNPPKLQSNKVYTKYFHISYGKLYEEIEKRYIALLEIGIQKPGYFFFNSDETSCEWKKDNGELIFLANQPKEKYDGKSSPKAHITFLPTTSMSGVAQKHYILKKTNIRSLNITNAMLLQTKSAFMTSDIWWEFLTDLVPVLRKKVLELIAQNSCHYKSFHRNQSAKDELLQKQMKIKPILLVDSARVHPKDVSDLFKQFIDIIYIPSGLTAYLQPLDLFTFGVFKKNLGDSAITERTIEKRLEILDELWDHTIKRNDCRNGFNRLGFREDDDGVHTLKKIIKVKNIHGKDEFEKTNRVKQAEKINGDKYTFKKTFNLKSEKELFLRLCREDPAKDLVLPGPLENKSINRE